MRRHYFPHGLRRTVAVTLATWIGLPSISFLMIAACAASDESAAPDTDGAAVIPANDSGASADAADLDGPAVPCAVGSLCRPPTPLTIGAVTSIGGRSKGDVWASGTRGLLMHWSGQQWTPIESGIGNHTLSNIFVSSDETWGIAGLLVVRCGSDPKSVRTVRIDDFSHYPSSIAVSSNGDVYLTMAPGRRSDVALQPVARLDFDSRQLDYLPDPVLPWTDESQRFAVRASFLVPQKALWVVGDVAAVIRYPVLPPGDGGSAHLGLGVVVPLPSQVDLLAVWGHGEHLWTTGRSGTIFHFDGARWQTEKSGTTATLNAIYGTSPDDIWAVGDEGTVLHFDGTEWSPVGVGAYHGRLGAVWGAAPDDVWIGGEEAMFHWGPLP